MDIQDWIAPEYLSDEWIADAAKRYADARPFPHANIPDFLRKDRFAELVEASARREYEHKESDLFSLAQTADLSKDSKGPIALFARFLNSDQFRGWINKLTGVVTRPGALDLFGAVYGDTDYLLCHDDQLEDRKIAFILYLTTLATEDGGALALYADTDGHPDEKAASYRPVENTLNLFTVSPVSWHEVEEVTGETQRVSLGGWLRG